MEYVVDGDLLGLITLLGEKNTAVRRRYESLRKEQDAVPLSAGEWKVFSRVADRRASISELARSQEITRQAIHKYIRALEEKGLLRVAAAPGNKRSRNIELTDLGKRYWTESRDLERRVENEVASAIGGDEFARLKELLRRSWL